MPYKLQLIGKTIHRTWLELVHFSPLDAFQPQLIPNFQRLNKQSL
jgi:hypothetical protein